MASYSKRGDSYTVRWREGDVNRSRAVPDEATAKQLVAEIERVQALGRVWEPQKPRVRSPLVEVAEDWVRSLSLRLDARTVAVRIYQLSVWERFCAGRVEHVDELSRPLLEDYLRHLETTPGRHGKVRSRTTALRLVEVVELLWEWAWDAASERSYTDVPQPRRITLGIPRPSTPWRRSPTWAEMAACVGAASGWLRPLLVVLYYTGLRPDQALRLHAQDLDPDARALYIRPELGKSRQERSGRLIPVSPHLVEALASLAPTGAWLLPCDRTRRAARARDVAECWSRAQVRPVVWTGRPHTAFRAGLQTNILAASRLHQVAIEHLVGHKVGDTAPNYLDPDAFGMREAVAVIPKLEDLWNTK